MNVKYLQLFFLLFLLANAGMSMASEPEIDGVFGFEEATETLAIAVWVPLAEGESVEGMSWFNNDANAVFPAIKAMAGIAERPDDLANAVLSARTLPAKVPLGATSSSNNRSRPLQMASISCSRFQSEVHW